jgi:hypothetical protein
MELAFFRPLTRKERLWIALGYNISLRTNIYTAHKPGAYDGKMSLHVVSDKVAATEGKIPEQVWLARWIRRYYTETAKLSLRKFAIIRAVRRLIANVRQARG